VTRVPQSVADGSGRGVLTALRAGLGRSETAGHLRGESISQGRERL
jgi:hypothetical protein